MKRRIFLTSRLIAFSLIALLSMAMGTMRADETITVTATSSDISENLDLKTLATLFGQAKDLEQFEQLLNNPDSAFSNLDLNGDGEVDYLRVIETADNNRHLVVIQAVLAKDIYQDVASIFVEKDENNQITVQVVGDEYIYGENYIIEPVYIYRPVIYDWFWGPSWVCWHSPYYWGYYPHWWHPYHCIDPFLYWDHCYWHHYHHPICSYRTVHHHHPHYRPMHDRVRRNDFAQRHPDRSFVTRNASRNMQNARQLDQQRRSTMRSANAAAPRGSAPATRVSASSTMRGNAQATRNTTYGSTNVRRSSTAATSTTRSASATRSASTVSPTRSASATRSTSTVSPTRSASTTRSTSTVSPTRSTSTTRATSTSSPSRSSSSSVRSSSSSTMRSTSSSVRSSSSSVSRSSGTMSSGSRSGGSSSRSSGSTRR